MNIRHSVALSIGAMLLAGQAWAQDVVMFRDAAPQPQELADIMFPQAQPPQPVLKFRGIRFTEPMEASSPALQAIAQASEPPEPQAVGFNVQFAFNSADLLPETMPHLDSMGEMLKLEQAAGQRVRIAGHADASGSEAYNLWLSQARAEAVQAYLVDKYGIAPERLDVAGYGEAQPLDGTDPYAAVNRRVEFSALQ